MESTHGSREESPETLEEFLAKEMDMSVESLQEKADQIFIQAPWEAEAVRDHE